MRNRSHVQTISAALLPGLLLAVFAAAGNAEPGRKPVHSRPAPASIRLPLSFEENRGQTHPSVRFTARGTGYALFLTDTEAVLRVRRPEKRVRDLAPGRPGARPEADRRPADVIRLTLAGAKAARLRGERRRSSRAHYIGPRTRSATNVPMFAAVRSVQPYPGIDMVYYGKERELEYDFVVHPTADPDQIRLRIQGAAPRVLADGSLALRTPAGDLRMAPPVTYQDQAGSRRSVTSSYRMVAADTVGFRVGNYDRRRELVIDPVLLFADYLGGTGFDTALGTAMDATGAVYVTGYTESAEFPLVAPAQAALSGDADAFVSKLSPDGSLLVYSTFFGGTGLDAGADVAVDSAGAAFVSGLTDSADFPVAAAFQGSSGGGQDGFLVKLNPAGSAVTFSTYLGGAGSDAATNLTVDGAGGPVVTGYTNSGNFPTASPLFGPRGDYDAFVIRMTGAGAVVFSTYLGGRDGDGGNGVAVDQSGNVFVGGSTDSGDYPTVGLVWQPTFRGGRFGDVFMTKLAPDGSAILLSQYYGGTGSDLCCGISVDRWGYVTVAGTTESFDAVKLEAPLVKPFQENHITGGTDIFVAKFFPDMSEPVYFTLFAGNGDDVARAMGTDDDVDTTSELFSLLGPSKIYVFGDTDSTDLPLVEPMQTALGGGTDAFVVKMHEDFYLAQPAVAVDYGTLFGGTGLELAEDMAVDAVGNLSLVGSTDSEAFPTHRTFNSRNNLRGPADGFVAKVMDGVPQPGGTLKLTQPAAFGTTKPLTKVERVLTIKNTHKSQFLAFRLTNPRADGPFSIPRGVLSAYLGPGQSFSVPLQFLPIAPGTFKGKVTVFSSDPYRARANVDVTGIGKAPRPPSGGGGGTGGGGGGGGGGGATGS